MKNKKVLYSLLMFLPLVVTVAALFFLPDSIPAHYGADGQVNRWGSKYESLLLPVISILFGIFMIVMGRVAGKSENGGKNNEKVAGVAGLCGLAVFDAMTGYFLFTAFQQTTNLYETSIDLFSVMTLLLGVGLIVLGNVMPKAKRNALIGLRTPWSLKNDVVWKKCQRFGGISFMIAGVLVIIGCAFMRGIMIMIWGLGLILLAAVVGMVYSYRAARGDTEEKIFPDC